MEEEFLRKYNYIGKTNPRRKARRTSHEGQVKPFISHTRDLEISQRSVLIMVLLIMTLKFFSIMGCDELNFGKFFILVLNLFVILHIL